MPEQNLYWIDDSSHDMTLVMRNVFPVLWNIDCSCKTILFGNDYCRKETEKGPSDKDREDFEADLKGFFTVYCQKIDEQEWEELGTTYKKKQHLLSEPSVFLLPLENDRKTLVKNWLSHDVLKGVNEHPEHLRELTADSNHVEQKDSGAVSAESEVKAGSLSVDRLVEDMKIPADAVVALDICLLYHDINRIEEGLPSISMALYDRFLKRNHHCYLYSSRIVARTVIERWVQTFQKLFKESFEMAGSIVVHPKRGLLVAAPDTDAKKALVSLLLKKE